MAEVRERSFTEKRNTTVLCYWNVWYHWINSWLQSKTPLPESVGGKENSGLLRESGALPSASRHFQRLHHYGSKHLEVTANDGSTPKRLEPDCSVRNRQKPFKRGQEQRDDPTQPPPPSLRVI